jgi:hypothetical protein
MPCISTKKLLAEKSELWKSQESYSASSRSYWSECGETSDSSKERHREPKRSRRKTARGREEERARSISTPLSDEEENFIQETPEAALVAAQAYLLTTRPEPGDPWEHMHQAAIKSLGLVEDKLRQHSLGKKSTYYEDQGKKSQKYQSLQSQSSDSSDDENRKARMEDARNIITQNKVKKHAMHGRKKTTRTMKRRWAHYALPEGFVECEYPKDSNYHTTSRSTMGHKSLGYGYQTIFKQCKY